jgi:hypothetical protein
VRQIRDKGIQTEAKFKDKNGCLSNTGQNYAKIPLHIDNPDMARIAATARDKRFSAATIRRFGAVDEWFKSHAWKACVG